MTTRLIERLQRALQKFGRQLTIENSSKQCLVTVIGPGFAQFYAPSGEVFGWDRPIYSVICLPGNFEKGNEVEAPDFNGVIECIEPLYLGSQVALQRLIVRSVPATNPF